MSRRHAAHPTVVAIMLSMLVGFAEADSVQSDSIALFGTWRWELTYGGFNGGTQAPASSNYGRWLQFNRAGTYSFVEKDSANCYVISSGKFTVRPTASPFRPPGAGRVTPVRGPNIWLELENWRDINHVLITYISPDTIDLYAGGGNISVSDDVTRRYIRSAASVDTPADLPVRPWRERPPRIVVSRGYRNSSLELQDSLIFAYVRLGPPQKVPDFAYPTETLRAYRYTHYQTPAAIIGDFDGNDSLDVAIYENGDSLSAIHVLLAGRNTRDPLTLLSKPNVLGWVPDYYGTGRVQSKLPQLFLEVARAGERIDLFDGGEVVLPRDAIRVVRVDGPAVVYRWEKDRFIAMATVRRE